MVMKINAKYVGENRDLLILKTVKRVKKNLLHRPKRLDFVAKNVKESLEEIE